jgi:hypothetical protein
VWWLCSSRSAARWTLCSLLEGACCSAATSSTIHTSSVIGYPQTSSSSALSASTLSKLFYSFIYFVNWISLCVAYSFINLCASYGLRYSLPDTNFHPPSSHQHTPTPQRSPRPLTAFKPPTQPPASSERRRTHPLSLTPFLCLILVSFMHVTLRVLCSLSLQRISV